MLKTFIERPVLSTVISIIIVVLGIIGLMTLPVEQYPDIAPPTVRVSATYSGANAEVVLNSVVVPLEEAINGVEGMTYITSTASDNGQASITIYFEQGTDPDLAAVNVQNLVSQASAILPQEVNQTGVTVRKSQNSTLLMLFYTPITRSTTAGLSRIMPISILFPRYNAYPVWEKPLYTEHRPTPCVSGSNQM